MEGNSCLASPPRYQRSLRTDARCSHELTLSHSDASFFTAVNCEDILGRSVDVAPDDCKAWTDEKHSMYIRQLEMSFVKQLHHSTCLLEQCPEQSWRDLNTSNTSHEQVKILKNGSLQKIYRRDGTPSSSVSADTHTPLKSKQLYNHKYFGKHGRPLSDLKPCNTMKHGTRKMAHGLATSSAQKFFPHKLSHGDLFHLTREGTGQNFSDEDHLRKRDSKSRQQQAEDGLTIHSQIVPCRKRLPVTEDYSTIKIHL